ncbi:MAG TPA: HD domain-containing phosphohydrolase [Terriglobales bacterium]|nr:HD domain-containing phosphohydrolase [Terriglobales bacterium]
MRSTCYADNALVSQHEPPREALQGTNLKKLLRTVEALADLGPELTADRDFSQTARTMLTAILEASGAREAVLFSFGERPSLLTSVGAEGFALLPEPSLIPLLPRHVHTLAAAVGPVLLNSSTYDVFLSANGNVAPELFKCICPLKVRSKLVGAIALGRRVGNEPYEEDALDALHLISSYVALSIQNHNLSQTLAQRVSENLRLLASLHGFYDNALEAFASAIDVKHVNIHGHSIRVGRYAQAIGEALGMESSEVGALRSAGYLHDIGKVAVDKRLFSKPSSLNPEEFREMADHTVVGHQIVSSVQFPWPQIPEIVRWHHERGDGTGYPDGMHADEMSKPVRIIALADTFDAMVSARPYREPLPLGIALQELIRMTPQKYDAEAMQALLIQIRRDAVGSNRTPVLEPGVVSLSASDVDQLASTLQHRISQNKVFVT